MTKRTEKIRIRLTPEELEHLKKCSSSSTSGRFSNGKENFSEYLRTKLLKESGYRNISLEQNVRKMQYELRKIGTNVNQVAKKINSGFGTPGDVKELQQNLQHINQRFEDFREEVEHAWQSQN